MRGTVNWLNPDRASRRDWTVCFAGASWGLSSWRLGEPASDGHLHVRLRCLQLHVIDEIPPIKCPVRGFHSLIIQPVRCFFSEMERPFTLEVFKSQGSFSFITKGFLKCLVSSTSAPFQSRQFSYCLYCRKLKSLSWFHVHKREVRFEPSPQKVAYFCAMFENYVHDIETEVDLLCDTGRLFLGDNEAVMILRESKLENVLKIWAKWTEDLPLMKKRDKSQMPTLQDFSILTFLEKV